MYHRLARRATLNTGQGVFKALKSFKYVKWYKKSLNCNFKRSYSWGWKGKNRDMAELNFKRQLRHWIYMSTARFKVKTRHGCLYVNVSLEGTVCPQKRIVGIFISSCLIKQHLWARCCFVYSRYRGNGPLLFQRPLLKRHLVAENEFAFPFPKAYLMFRSTHVFYAANTEL